MEVVGFVVTGIFGGGLVLVVTTIITGRRTAEKIRVQTKALEAKLPGEVDGIAVAGAERAVLMLQGTNETLVSENERLIRENGRLHAVIQTLETKVETYRRSMEQAEATLAAARREYEDLHAEFNALRAGMSGGGVA